MSTQTTYHFHYKKENHPKSSQICSYGIFSKGLKNKFETAVVNKPSVLVNKPSMFEPLKVYCTMNEMTDPKVNVSIRRLMKLSLMTSCNWLLRR